MNRSHLFGAAFVPFLLLGSAGCGPNCQEACNKLYSDNEGGCAISKPNSTLEENIKECRRECETALDYVGELDGYDPDERQGTSESVTLENEKQAAVWMDCVMETVCEDLRSGYCAPLP